jgi:hypothetical protein
MAGIYLIGKYSVITDFVKATGQYVQHKPFYKINKLKTIKRQMYGRASLELFKRKVIYSKTG